MTESELREILKLCLTHAALKDQRGDVLYSGIDTLTRGASPRFYFIGFNPAKGGTNSLLCDVPLNRQDWSAYTQQCWEHEGKCKPGCPMKGKSRHQVNVQGIMEQLDIKPEKTFATNFIFVESKNVSELRGGRNFRTYVEQCWCVHEKMLAGIRPDYIVCLGHNEEKGRSAFSLVREKSEEEFRDRVISSEGKVGKVRKFTAFKKFKGKFLVGDGDPLTPTVVGVLHPSYWESPFGLRKFIGC